MSRNKNAALKKDFDSIFERKYNPNNDLISKSIKDANNIRSEYFDSKIDYFRDFINSSIVGDNNPPTDQVFNITQADINGLNSDFTIMDHQIEGINWLLKMNFLNLNCLLADEPGVGKTTQIISLLVYLYGFKPKGTTTIPPSVVRRRMGLNLIIVPIIVLNNWMDEFQKISSAYAMRVICYHDKMYSPNDFLDRNIDTIVMAYTDLIRITNKIKGKNINRNKIDDLLFNVSWNYVILDEAQFIKSGERKKESSVPGTTRVLRKRTNPVNFKETSDSDDERRKTKIDNDDDIEVTPENAFSSIKKIKCRLIILMTGTPIQNNVEELWNVLNLLIPSIFYINVRDNRHNKFADLYDIKSFVDNEERYEKMIIKLKSILDMIMLQRTFEFIMKNRIRAGLSNNIKKIEKLLCIDPTPLQVKLNNVIVPNNNRSEHNVIIGDARNKDEVAEKARNIKQQYIYDHPYIACSNEGILSKNAEEIRDFIDNYSDNSDDPVYLSSITHNSPKFNVLFKLIYKILEHNANNYDEDLSTKPKETTPEKETRIRNEIKRWDALVNVPLEETSVLIDKVDNNSILEANEKISQTLTDKKNLPNKIIIFAFFIEVLDLIGTCLTRDNIGYYRIDGQHKNNADVNAKKFKEEKNSHKVFLMTARAAGVGINLQSANYVIFIDTDYNPQVDMQAVGRAWRSGQERNVTVIRFRLNCQFEINKFNQTQQKRALAQYILVFPSKLKEGGGMSSEEVRKSMIIGYDYLFTRYKNTEMIDNDFIGNLIDPSYEDDDIVGLSQKANNLFNLLKEYQKDVRDHEIVKEKMEEEFEDEKKETEKEKMDENEKKDKKDEKKKRNSDKTYTRQYDDHMFLRPDQIETLGTLEEHIDLIHLYERMIKESERSDNKEVEDPDGNSYSKDELETIRTEQINKAIKFLADKGETADADGVVDKMIELRGSIRDGAFVDWSEGPFEKYLESYATYLIDKDEGLDDVTSIENMKKTFRMLKSRLSDDKLIKYHEKFIKDRFQLVNINDYDESIHQYKEKHIKMRKPFKVINAFWLKNTPIDYGSDYGTNGYSKDEDLMILDAYTHCRYNDWDTVVRLLRSLPPLKYNWFMQTRNQSNIKDRFYYLHSLIEKQL